VTGDDEERHAVMTTRTPRSSLFTLAVSIPLVALLAGCAPEPIPEPTINWKPAAPSGAYEDSEWVQTIRTFEWEYALAFNRHDYTSSTLAEVVSSGRISHMARVQQQNAEDAEFNYFPGPLPFNVVSVTEDGDTARVIVCMPTPAWLISKDRPEPSLEDATEAIYDLIRTDSGSIKLDTSGITEHPCDLSNASIGLFDPQPDVSVSYSPDDVKAP
jgi:hypothetical protein